MCSSPLPLVPEHLHFPKRHLCPFGSYSLFLPPSSPLETDYLISITMDFPTLDISNKWDHVRCGLLCPLLSLGLMFSRLIHIVIWMVLCSFFTAEQYSVPGLDPLLFTHSSTDGHLGWLYIQLLHGRWSIISIYKMRKLRHTVGAWYMLFCSGTPKEVNKCFLGLAHSGCLIKICWRASLVAQW